MSLPINTNPAQFDEKRRMQKKTQQELIFGIANFEQQFRKKRLILNFFFRNCHSKFAIPIMSSCCVFYGLNSEIGSNLVCLLS